MALALACVLLFSFAAVEPTWAQDAPDAPAEDEMQAAASNPMAAITWNRIWGPDALDTMELIVRAGGFPTGGVVVLATEDGFWDALTASGLAGLADAPVVMTDGSSLSFEAESALETLKPQVIVVCGGQAAISESVAKAAGAAAGGATVARCWGDVASDTAIAIFEEAPEMTGASWSRTAFVCTDASYHDALSASPVSYALHMPIFLTTGSDDISRATLNAMKNGNIDHVYIVGGTEAISPAVEREIEAAGVDVAGRLWGDTAIETSAAVAEFGMRNGMTASGMGVATTGGYWDALAGAAFCGRSNAVIVLVNGPDCSAISGFVRKNAGAIGTGYIFGGPAAVSYSTELALNGQPHDTQSSLMRAYRDDEDVQQLLFVEGTGGTYAQVELYQKAGASWTRVLSCEGWIGEDGIGQASEWSSATPEGDFEITGAFGVRSDPGTELPYLKLDDSYYWCSDELYYNELVDIYENPHYCTGEHLIDSPVAYAYGLFFDYNTDPVVYGAGSAFFIHCKIDASYTQGCVMVEQDDMVEIIQSLSPGARVCIY